MELEQGETIAQIIRRHWITLVGPIISAMLVLAVLIAIGAYLQINFAGWIGLVYGVVIGITVLYLWYMYFLWRRNYLVVTNLRVVYNQRLGLFDHEVTQLLYNNITDISFTQAGVIAVAYDFGNLEIRVPTRDQIVIEDIPHPAAVIEMLNQMRLALTDRPQGPIA